MPVLFEQCHFSFGPPPPGAHDALADAKLLKGPVFKYLPPEYADAFMRQGLARFGSLKAFRRIESCGATRFDRREGVRYDYIRDLAVSPMAQGANTLTTVMRSPQHDLVFKNCQVIQSASEGMLFCFSRRASSRLAAKFGSPGRPATCVLIRDLPALIERLANCVSASIGSVTSSQLLPCVYRHHNAQFHAQYSEEHPAFVKPFRFADEVEVRAYWQVENETAEYTPFKLGPLSDICEVVPEQAVLDFEKRITVGHPGRDADGVLRQILIGRRGVVWGQPIGMPSTSATHDRHIEHRKSQVIAPRQRFKERR